MGIDDYLETANHTNDDGENSTADNYEESDEDKPEIPPPTAHDMEAALQTLQHYAATNDVDDVYMDNLNYIKLHFLVNASSNVKQIFQTTLNIIN